MSEAKKTDDDEITKAIKNIINYANPGETNIIETGTGTGKVNLHYNDDSLKRKEKGSVHLISVSG